MNETASPAPWASASPPKARPGDLHRHVGLWALQTGLAMFFIAAGYAKLSQPQALLSLIMSWPALVSSPLLQAIGWIEILLGLGVVAPLISWRRLRAPMRFCAGALTASTTIMAVFHFSGGEAALGVTNGMLAAMSLAVVVGRRRGEPRPFFRRPVYEAASHLKGTERESRKAESNCAIGRSLPKKTNEQVRELG